MGFNLENCEVWFERAVIGLMTLSAVVIIIRVSRTISPAPHPDRTNRRRLLLFCAIGPFRHFNIQLLLSAFPFSIVVNVHRIHGITSYEHRLAPSYIFVAQASRFGIPTLGGRHARGVRLFSYSVQQLVRGTSKRNASCRGLDISHRAFLTVFPSTVPPTSPLWEDKPLCSLG